MSTRVETALVLGGSGAVGSAVARALHDAGVAITFTHHHTPAGDVPGRAVKVDLSDSKALRAALADVRVDALVHCATVSQPHALEESDDDSWCYAHTVNVQSAFIAAQCLAPAMRARKRGHIVFVGALDRAQSLPMPLAFAATQGALSAMTMALAKELGPDGVFVNQVALGVLDGGISATLGESLAADYRAFSALRRVGRVEEAAKAIVWLVLENTYMSGKVVPVNGGI